MNEEIVISCLMRFPSKSMEIITQRGLKPDHFLADIAKRVFSLLLERWEKGLSLQPEEIYQDSPEALREFDGVISGLALFAQWRLNREADGKIEKAIAEILHESLIRNRAGKLKTIISR